MNVQALFYKAKDFRSHYYRHDLLTPQPLKRADFWFNDVNNNVILNLFQDLFRSQNEFGMTYKENFYEKD